MIKIAFGDDDMSVLDELKGLIDRYRAGHNQEIWYAAFCSSLELLAEIEKGVRYDILFLDIIWPNENGIDIAKEIRQYDSTVKIIFLTSSPEFAVQSYTVGAYFYQIKPIREDRFFDLMDSAISEHQKERQRSLILRCKSGITRVDLDRLEYCEVLGRTLLFHMENGKTLEGSGSMDKLYEQLSQYENFVRPHRSFLINIQLVNLVSVGIFGMALSAAFCDIWWTKKKVFAMAGGVVAILLFQGIVYLGIDPDIVEKLYPLITHIPLTILLCALNRKFLWPTISVLTAYLCCQLRRWIALLIVFVFSGGSNMQDIVELVMTFPILLILIRFVAPTVRSVSHYQVSLQCQFGLVPALYYGFDYLTRIYTNLLLEGVLVAIEFMPFVCSLAYLLFVVYISRAQQIRGQLEQTQAVLNLQIRQAVREIAALREALEKTVAYRHDMRHHMQFLSSCIENGQLRKAQGYIREICSEIEGNKVKVFCENEVANLIFSAFARRAEESGIKMQVRAEISQGISVSETDLCVLLSNALENALRGAGEKGRAGVIEVMVYEKNEKLFLQIMNSCEDDVAFDNGIPVTNRPGHGIGVRSICAIVEKYDGVYTFSMTDGAFILRIAL